MLLYIGLSNGKLEQLCVLYNISALMGQIAATCNFSTDDGLKTAMKYFQVRLVF